MRAFIAVDFDKETKGRIADIQRHFRPYALKGRWTYIDNLHLTLKFLGEIEEHQQELIASALEKASRDFSPFILETGKPEYSGAENISTFRLGISGDITRLNQLHDKLEQELEDIGVPKDTRTFRPHITIGRDVVIQKWEEVKTKLPLSTFKIPVTRISFMKSEVIDRKRIYTPLKYCDFKLYT